MLIGAHSHLFRGSPAAVAAAFRKAGLSCLQLTPRFPGLRFDQPADFTPARCRDAAAPFLDAGIRVAGVSLPGNLLNPNLDYRHRDIVRLHCLIRHCRDFGCERVVTETGSVSTRSPLTTDLLNRTQAAWSEMRLIVAEALRIAADHGVALLLKPGPTHVLATVEEALRLRDELACPALGFVLDPAHFLVHSKPDIVNDDLAQLVERLRSLTPVVHAKDLRWDEDRTPVIPRVGRGLLDYAVLLRRLRVMQPEVPIILEHVRPDEVGAARAFMEGVCKAASGTR
jgi:sugar phosphate isomerase/epimerase